MMITNEQIIEKLKTIIDTKTGLSENEYGDYEEEIYADYRDEFEEPTIRKIFKADNPRDMFYDLINDTFFEHEHEYYHDTIKTIKEHFNDAFSDCELDIDLFAEHEDFIRDWVHEHIHFNYPYDHYLRQDVYLDIMLDTGDGNYDYTLNELFGCKYSESGYEGRELSAMVWLMKQQGYSVEQIIDFIQNENDLGSKFLQSVHQECMNTSSCMNALTFFVKMSLKEALDLNERVNSIRFSDTGYEKDRESQEARQGNIVINKNSTCGLYDPWNGAGSVLEIALEKDVEVPLKFVDSLLPDGCRGYSVSAIYGVCGSLWSDYSVRITEEAKAA